jgi:hypothetical protein
MNIKLIELTELSYWDNAATPKVWKPLQVSDGTLNYSVGPGSQMGIVLYNAGLGNGLIPTADFSQNIAWDYLQVNDGSGITGDWTIFGASAPLIATTVPSLKIRYRLKVTDMADPANVFQPTTMYYQIIKAGYPTDHITYSSGGTTGPWAPIITVYLPGISNTMVAGASALHSWLTQLANWQIEWMRPDFSSRVLQPLSISVTVADNATANYGGARVSVIMTLPSLAVGQSGAHTLAVSLLPNDQDISGGFFKFADGHTWTATITPLTPSIKDPLYISFDVNTFMSIDFGT